MAIYFNSTVPRACVHPLWTSTQNSLPAIIGQMPTDLSSLSDHDLLKLFHQTHDAEIVVEFQWRYNLRLLGILRARDPSSVFDPA